MLQDLEGYLCSPFDNVRGEAAGPLAFKTYWDRISTRIDFHGQELPNRLKTSLGAMYDAFGGERPSYLPEDTQTEQVRLSFLQCVLMLIVEAHLEHHT